LTYQDATTTLESNGIANFHFNAVMPAGATLHLAIYPSLVDRGQLAPIIDGSGDAVAPIDQVDLTSSACAFSGHHFSLRITAGGVGEPSRCGKPLLHLSCALASCAGVYPLRYSVTENGLVSNTWSLVAVRSGPVATPLHVIVLANLDSLSWTNPPATIAFLNALHGFSTEPVTIGANYSTLANAEIATSASASAWRTALNRALASPEHQAIVAPPSTSDFGGLAHAGFSDEVSQQLTLGGTLLRTLTGRFTSGPVWLGSGTTTADLAAVTHAGANQVVLDESALTPTPSSTLLWGAPEHIAGVPGVTVLATDDPLAALANNPAVPAVLRAVLTIDTLSFLHFDAPNDPSVRTEVLVLSPPLAGAGFVHALLAGLINDPFARLSTFAPSFASSLVGSNGIRADWNVASAATSTWSSANSSTLSTLLMQEQSFVQGLASPGIVAALNAAVAEAEIKGDPSTRQQGLETAQSLLNQQLNNFHIDNSSVTLTSQGTALPITLVSHAHYSMTVLVHLISPSLQFSKGRVFAATLATPTTALRVALKHASGTNVTLQIVVTTPNGHLVLARTAVQVRITGTSIVGYLMSFLSLVVLAMWWLRTYRRSSSGKHVK
jgi:hypothetical protein